MLTTKFFIQCYKFQVQDHVVVKNFSTFGLLNSFTFLPPPYPYPCYFSVVHQSAIAPLMSTLDPDARQYQQAL